MPPNRDYTAVPQELFEGWSDGPPPRPPKVPLPGNKESWSSETRLDPEEPWKARSFRQRWLGGLQLTLRLWVTLSALVLTCNVSWLAWAWLKYQPENGYGTLQTGDCKTSQDLNRWLHLIINILSTLLLLGSAAFMSVAAAPSLEEVQLAHRKGKWLSIGLISASSIRSISVRKTITVLVLALTSVPVHLFFNSVIFPALAGNDYLWAVTTQDFQNGAAFNLSDANQNVQFEGAGQDNYDLYNNFTEVTTAQFTNLYKNIQNIALSYERLDNANCIEEYSRQLVSDRRNLILVSSATNTSNSVFVWYFSVLDSEGGADPTNWICSQDPGDASVACDAKPYLANASHWTVFDYPILYCLSEKAEAACSIKFSTTLALVVIICNVIKLGAEIYVLYWTDLDQAITCVGDAIAVFLGTPDGLSENMSMLESPAAVAAALKTSVHQRSPVQYRASRPRLGRAISNRRWLCSMLILLAAVGLVCILFAWGLSFIYGKGFDITIGGLWRLGFGDIDPKILIASENFGTPATVSLLANTPQLVLAIIYYMYGGMLTAFFTTQEYADFARKKQYLRVARPAGKQQGTWMLGMPFIWGVFFQAVQTLLHWFVSQGFFVVDVSAYNIDGSLNTLYGSILNCGFSPFPIFCAVLTATFMSLLVIALGLRRLPARSPPNAGSNSALIAAACQPRRFWDVRMPYLALKWGCIDSDSRGVGHCSFALAVGEAGVQKEPQPLVEGKWYR